MLYRVIACKVKYFKPLFVRILMIMAFSCGVIVLFWVTV